MRIERHDRGREPGPDRGVEERAVTQVHAVEGPDRDGARPPHDLAGRVGDLHPEPREGVLGSTP